MNRRDWLAEAPADLQTRIRGQKKDKYGSVDQATKDQFRVSFLAFNPIFYVFFVTIGSFNSSDVSSQMFRLLEI